MSANALYNRDVIATVFTTELNSQANNALVLSSALTITLTGAIYAELELVVTFGTNPTAATGISFWFLREVDGTNYEDGGTSVTPARTPDLVMPVLVSTSAQRIIRIASIPTGLFKVLIKNDGTGQSFAATNNTLKIRPFTLKQG